MASAADNYTLALGDDIFCGVLCTPHMCMCLAPANNHDNLARGSRRMGASTNGGEHPRFAQRPNDAPGATPLQYTRSIIGDATTVVFALRGGSSAAG